MSALILIVVAVFILLKFHKKKIPSQNQTNDVAENKRQKYKDLISKERDMSKLTPEGELPVGWVFVHEDFIKDAEKEVMYFYGEYYKYQYGEPAKKYAALKSLLQYFEDAKRIYKKKGECYLYWFENSWAKSDKVEQLQSELHYLEEHFDEIEENYKKRQYIENILIPDLKKQVIEIVKNNPGIVQTELYAHFNPEVKDYVQDVCRTLFKENKIKREKYGRTFKLTI